jgi:hypothetical protein
MGMKLTQEMVRRIADKTWGKRQFTLANGMNVDLGSDGTDWPKVSFVGVIKERFGDTKIIPLVEDFKHSRLLTYDAITNN